MSSNNNPVQVFGVLLYYLTVSQDIQTRLQEDIDDLFENKRGGEDINQDDINDMREEGKNGTEVIKLTTSTPKLLNVVLEGLDTSTEYWICVSTVVNGRTLAQRSERIKPKIQ